MVEHQVYHLTTTEIENTQDWLTIEQGEKQIIDLQEIGQNFERVDHEVDEDYNYQINKWFQVNMCNIEPPDGKTKEYLRDIFYAEHKEIFENANCNKEQWHKSKYWGEEMGKEWLKYQGTDKLPSIESTMCC